MTTLSIKYRSFDGFERALNAQMAHFQQLHPDVTFVSSHAGPEELYAEMVEHGGVHSGDYDIMLVLTDWLPDLQRRNGLRALNHYVHAHPPADWPHGWSDSLLQLQRDHDGTIYGLPYHDGPEMFHYRADLFENPAEQQLFSQRYGRTLRVPQTWNEFREVAQFFTRPDHGLYGAVIAGLNDGHNNVYDFFIHLWSRGGTLFDAQLNPVFNNEIGVDALQFYVDSLTSMAITSPKACTYDSVAAGVAYAAGEGAMMLNWAGFMSVAQLPPSTIINKTRCTTIPRGDNVGGRHASLNVYWVLSICAGSKHPDLAYAFLRETASPAMDKITSISGGSGVRKSTWNDPEIQAQFQYYEVMEQVHTGIDTLPALPEYPALNDVFSRMTWAAVSGQKSVRQALNDAANECQRILHT